MQSTRIRFVYPALLLALAVAPSAQFTVDQSVLPSGTGINSSTEQVDFGDIDLDGDWDIAVADGGDDGNDQNRCWVNAGGLGGGTLGQFVDETDTRFPVVSDSSRDVEFVDFEGDGDLDLYVANHGNLINQTSRFWVNLGLEQGATLGFYADETDTRWVDLGVAGPTGSSIAPSLLLPGGGFLDWVSDGEFADFDNDGDLDLLHASVGDNHNGRVPSRIFLNDGTGHFQEYNPSGFQLAGADIADDDPGLWCEGQQSQGTDDASGLECDIATVAVDADVADLDGDFDLDILLGDRELEPRVFANRLDGSGLAPAAVGGVLGFRDVTSASLPPNHAPGNGHYEQELGDMDGDGDVDILGVNWQIQAFGFDDATYANDGAGSFSPPTILDLGGADDEEADCLDYDNDGDLDLFVANFSGQDKLYRNDTVTQDSLVYASVGIGDSYSSTSRDADACDTDGDGDYDVVVASDNFQANRFLRNVTEVPDTHAPYLPRIEDLPDRVASRAPIPVRTQVYDNAPYYITWYNKSRLDVFVDGTEVPHLGAFSSGGQVFRAELPGNLLGTVSYFFRSEDGYENEGVSPSASYVGSYGIGFSSLYGTGTAGLTGGEPTLTPLSVFFGDAPLYLAVESGAPAGSIALVAIGTGADVAGTVLPQIGQLHLSGIPLFLHLDTLDAAGQAVAVADVPPIPAGIHVYAQGFVLDATAGGFPFASSKGLDLVSQ
ncbi:MAG: VCBS repeat-containing protein [Planctomycetota bacterium]